MQKAFEITVLTSNSENLQKSEVFSVSDKSDKYMSFEKVLKELQIEESELKKLVSAGEIKAFRDADEMRFNAEEVAKLKKNKPSDPDVIELLDTDEELDSEPTLDLESTEIAEELSFDDVSLDDGSGTETLDFGESEDLLGDDLGDSTESQEMELGSLELDEEDSEDLAPARGASRRSSTQIKKTKIAGVSEEVEDAEPQWVLGVLILSAILLLLGTVVMMDVATSSPSPLVGWLVGMFS
ncbi:MAG: hypothetical protein ABIK28_01045 [Planctomycetota bacterium]